MRISRRDLDIAVKNLNDVSKQRYTTITYEDDTPKYQLAMNGLKAGSLTGKPKPLREVYIAVQGILNYLYYEKRGVGNGS